MRSLLLIFSITALSACELLKPVKPEILFDKLSYDESQLGNQLSKGKDSSNREFLEGNGALLYKKKMGSEAAKVEITVKAVFKEPRSLLKIYSHSMETFKEAYEITFERLGSTLRVSTAINGANPTTLGSLITGIENWKAPLTMSMTVDNSGQASFKISDGSVTLEEVRKDSYPRGDRVGLEIQALKLYSFTVRELN